mmetsp:Transcript_54494/g.60905  ORF Transcript_54494/g.60905 Transcript_54494/m.60905 type:complete len:219 (+) Transcript_54494:1978-2634(+)
MYVVHRLTLYIWDRSATPNKRTNTSYNRNCPEIIHAAHNDRLPRPRNKEETPLSSIMRRLPSNTPNPLLLSCATYVRTASAGCDTKELRAPLNPPATKLTDNDVQVASLSIGETKYIASHARSKTRNFRDPNITWRVIKLGNPLYNDFKEDSAVLSLSTLSVPLIPSEAIICKVPINPRDLYRAGSVTTRIRAASNGVRPKEAITAASAPAIKAISLA